MKDYEVKIIITVIVSVSAFLCSIALGPHRPAAIPEKFNDYQACLKEHTEGALEKQMLLDKCLKVKELEK